MAGSFSFIAYFDNVEEQTEMEVEKMATDTNLVEDLRDVLMKGFPTPDKIDEYIEEFGVFPDLKSDPENRGDPLDSVGNVTHEQAKEDIKFLQANSYDGPVISQNHDIIY